MPSRNPASSAAASVLTGGGVHRFDMIGNYVGEL
jgi:hypothetical protein